MLKVFLSIILQDELCTGDSTFEGIGFRRKKEISYPQFIQNMPKKLRIFEIFYSNLSTGCLWNWDLEKGIYRESLPKNISHPSSSCLTLRIFSI